MIDYRIMIKTKREEKDISQNQLAKMVGITQTFLSEIENGKKNPSIDVFFRICESLEIQIFPNE